MKSGRQGDKIMIDGMKKLKIAITILLMICIFTYISAYVLGTDTQNSVDKAYSEMTSSEQQILNKYYDKLPDDSLLAGIVGWSMIILSIGLFVLFCKLWGMKGI